MDGFWIMLGLFALALTVDRGLVTIANALIAIQHAMENARRDLLDKTPREDSSHG